MTFLVLFDIDTDILIQAAAGTPNVTMDSASGSSRYLNGSGRRCYFQIISMDPQQIEEFPIGVWRQLLDCPKSWKFIASSVVGSFVVAEDRLAASICV
jgi:hypothetical protein